MKLLFKAAQLKELFDLTKKGTRFLKPYEGGAFKPQPSVWLVKDDGIYLMPCTHDRPHPLPAGLIVYAKGHGKGTHVSGDDYVETIPIDPRKFWDLANRGYDFQINITASHMDIGFLKPVNALTSKA